MHTTARHLRNDRIVELRSKGWKIADIARKVGITERHCGRVLRERRQPRGSSSEAPGGGTGTDPSDAPSTELLDQLQSSLEGLSAAVLAGSPGIGTVLRTELVRAQGQRALDELRRRGERFTSAARERPNDRGERSTVTARPSRPDMSGHEMSASAADT